MAKRQKGMRVRKAVAEVRPFAYQPSKAELDAEVNIDADPEALALCLVS